MNEKIKNLVWKCFRATFIIENADATPPHLEVTVRLGALMGCRVLCSSLHLGCSADFCELHLYTWMECAHVQSLHVREQHCDKREQPRCELRSALHVLRQTGSNRDLHGGGAASFFRHMRQRNKNKTCAHM